MFKQNGFSLIELIMTLILVGVLATYVVVKSPNKASVVQGAQAELFTHHIRHAQALAMQWGQALRFSVSANAYSVRCVTVTLQSPCNTTPVVDPATGTNFAITLESGLSLSASGSTLDFDSLGRPLVSGSVTQNDTVWQLSGGGVTTNITVRGVTGMVVSS